MGTMKIIVVWIVMSCSLIHVCQYFGHNYCFHIQAERLCEDGKCRFARDTDSSLPTRLHVAICQNRSYY